MSRSSIESRRELNSTQRDNRARDTPSERSRDINRGWLILSLHYYHFCVKVTELQIEIIRIPLLKEVEVTLKILHPGEVIYSTIVIC